MPKGRYYLFGLPPRLRMNYFLAVYLGISIVTIFTNNPVLVYAVDLDTTPEISYLTYSDYNSTQDYYSQVSNPLAIEKQRQEELKARQALEEQARQQQIVAQQRQIAIAKQKKKAAKPKVAPNTSYSRPATAPSTGVEGLIYYWTSVYGGDPAYHVKIARCESGLNPNSVGGGGLYLGVYQQHAKYWPARAARYGFAGASPFDANANVAVSIAMMRGGMYSHWGCA